MALRARLTPLPTPAPAVWPWHTVRSKSLPVSVLAGRERRLDAEAYLTSGFAIRRAIESAESGVSRFGDLARAWTPPRIKMVHVDEEHGVPYLNTTQVFDIRATPRKWLSVEKMRASNKRFVKSGTILVMASASPGRTTIATQSHEACMISHHFMRLDLLQPKQKGWVYACLKSEPFRAMTSGSQYASIIRHIEPHHLEDLPIPEVDDATAATFNKRVNRIVTLRDNAYALTLEAERLFAEAIGDVTPGASETSFTVSASSMLSGRRRLEGNYHTPQAAAIFAKFKKWDRLGDITQRVWWMTRFKRYYGDGGLPYMSGDRLFSVNPSYDKRILVSPDDGHEKFFVKRDWIVMACSGQVYGSNGNAVITTDQHENVFFSHDLIRIKPDVEKARTGYLHVALTHPTHGRPLLIREAYGTSIPHLDPGDVADFPIVRLGDAKESAIADLAESSAIARAEADTIEQQIATEAGTIIECFIKNGK